MSASKIVFSMLIALAGIHQTFAYVVPKTNLAERAAADTITLSPIATMIHKRDPSAYKTVLVNAHTGDVQTIPAVSGGDVYKLSFSETGQFTYVLNGVEYDFAVWKDFADQFAHEG